MTGIALNPFGLSASSSLLLSLSSPPILLSFSPSLHLPFDHSSFVSLGAVTTYQHSSVPAVFSCYLFPDTLVT